MGPGGTGTDAGFIDLDSVMKVLYVSAWGSSGTDYVFSISAMETDLSAATVLTSHLKKPTGLSVDHLGKTTGGADLIVSSIGVPTKAGIPSNSTVVYRIDTTGEKIGRQTIFFTKQYPFMDIVLDFRSGNLVGTMNTLSTEPFFDQNTAQLFSSAQYCRKDDQLGFFQYEINGTDKCCATAVGGHLTISPGEYLFKYSTFSQLANIKLNEVISILSLRHNIILRIALRITAQRKVLSLLTNACHFQQLRKQRQAILLSTLFLSYWRSQSRAFTTSHQNSRMASWL
jgi:hypothetical protein